MINVIKNDNEIIIQINAKRTEEITLPEFLLLVKNIEIDADVVIDLSNVELLDSSFLGQIIILHRKCQTKNTKLKICNVSKNVLHLLKMCRFDKLLSINENC